MSLIKDKLDMFKEKDVYQLILFTMYKAQDIPSYKTMSELIFLLDKSNFLKMCEYYGGQTITIPTVTQLENFVKALKLYQIVLQGGDSESYIKSLTKFQKKKVMKAYGQIKESMKEFELHG